ncbi:ATP-binding protein [Nonomuraea mesophila]|uniref:ATP-binding protein n=1 Tax=Nonomuraea mesophila TaxID=2530382 RepID=UPI00140C2AE9|nr:ATP-binding protein [Nonomuraea mesophila]
MNDTGFDLLGQRLVAARNETFVGRQEELAVFDAALRNSGSVLFVHGPGGVGKSALLRQLAQQALAAGRSVTLLDGRTLGPSPAAFESAAETVFADERPVLLVDNFEDIQGLEGWLRERFLPRIPVSALVVLVGRLPPDLTWQADPTWAGTLLVLPLRDLSPVDAAALLEARGVAAGSLRESLLAFAGGHPLALSLGAAVAVKDERANSRWKPAQNVVATLLDQLVGEVPSPAHRHALEVCAQTYITTEDLLRAVLPDDDAATLFSWLRRLPFMESGTLGLHPHDVVREILRADLSWRDPQRYADLRQRIGGHLMAQVRTVPDSNVLRIVGSMFYLRHHRKSPPGRDFWHQEDDVYEEVFRLEETGNAVALVAEADGNESAAAVAFWAARQPEAFHLYRHTATGELAGVCVWLRLDRPGDEEAAADPVVAAAWSHARAVAPLRPGEHLSVGRIWVRDANQGLSTAMEWRGVGHSLRSERTAWSFMAVPADDHRVDYYRRYSPYELDEHVRLGDSEYTLFAHDWRALPAQVWLERLMSADTTTDATSVREPELAVLSRAEFTEAVRKALRHLSHTSALAANPLVRSRLCAGQPDPVQALRERLEGAIRTLGQDARTSKLQRALDITYLRGVPNQEAAAERLGLPFTTYRRHLTTGIERICEDLWQRELYGTNDT